MERAAYGEEGGRDIGADRKTSEKKTKEHTHTRTNKEIIRDDVVCARARIELLLAKVYQVIRCCCHN